MSSYYGERLKLSIFGQSHSTAIGMTMDDVPAGLAVDQKALQEFLNRRAPGQHEYATSRKELDVPEFISGIVNGVTCGAPITTLIHNTNIRTSDYDNLIDVPRPGHADYTAAIKYRGFQDSSGGGHFSGRLTAPMCIAGGLCMQWLGSSGIRIGAHISEIAGIEDTPVHLNWSDPDLDKISKSFPVVNREAGNKMCQAIAEAKKDQDSVGGVITCFVKGLPAGLGDPMFGGIENRIAQIIFGIPAVKGLEFGTGFHGSTLTGSQNNDSFRMKDGTVVTEENLAGGILGGITNGMPIVFRVAVKPTPSIAKPQNSVSLTAMENRTLAVHGRHDPCIVPRAVPVVEAAAAIAIFDAMLVAGRI